jgi:hypothetical protein
MGLASNPSFWFNVVLGPIAGSNEINPSLGRSFKAIERNTAGNGSQEKFANKI